MKLDFQKISGEFRSLGNMSLVAYCGGEPAFLFDFCLLNELLMPIVLQTSHSY